MENKFGLPEGNEIHIVRYIKFIETRPQRDLKRDGKLFNIHHILPKSLGGSNKNINLIKLTHREHFIAHLILWKAYGNGMAKAFHMMAYVRNNKKRLTARQVSRLKIDFYEAQKLFIPSEKMRENISKAVKSIWKNLSEDMKAKRIVNMKRKTPYKATTETIKKLSDSHKGHIMITDGIKNETIKNIKDMPEGWRIGRTNCNHKEYYYITNGYEDRRIDQYAVTPEGWIIGKRSKEVRNKQTYEKTAKALSGRKTITDGRINKRVKSLDNIPEGWSIGYTDNRDLSDELRKKFSIKANLNKITITDGKVTKYIPKDNAIPESWKKGSIERNKKENEDIKIICEKYSEGSSIDILIESFGVTQATVVKYLKHGTKLGWCNYSPKVGMPGKTVFLYKDTLFIKEFSSYKLCADYLNSVYNLSATNNTIYYCTAGKQASYKGFIFKCSPIDID